MTTYSYSKIDVYCKCPRRFKFKYIQRIKKDDDNPIFEKGHYIHYMLEHYPNPPPEPFKFKFSSLEMINSFKEIVMNRLKVDPELRTILRSYRIRSEQVFYLDRDLRPSVDKENALVTGIIDYIGIVNGELTFIDWKSGLTMKSNIEQVQFYAIWGFKAFPNFDTIKTILWYVENGEKIEFVLHRDDMDIIESNLINKIDEIEKDTTFKARPARHCDWCPYQNECIKEKLSWQST
jgi:CRISPR/Cas system-associated exonuclease Cas4 (RecB family)